MLALRYSKKGGLQLSEVPKPQPSQGETLVRVLRAGVCSTDIEICKGYVPEYAQTLGHEFVGIVEESSSNTVVPGTRVVGEINCPNCPANDEDPIFNRNHAPDRTVLGIINRDGALAQYLCLPAANLMKVPEGVSDQIAAYAEPLAAACRITEQQVMKSCGGDSVAVIGDGKLGLLIAQVLVQQSGRRVVHFGRHSKKLDLVSGTEKVLASDTATYDRHAQAFHVCVDATGSPEGLRAAMKITRPLGTIVLKSTCAPSSDPQSPQLAEVATLLVVNEMTVVGSRCGPFKPALELLQEVPMQKLLTAMTEATFPIEQGLEAFRRASSKGALKVQVTM